MTAHLEPFLAKHERGIAEVCEQVGEAVHYNMAPVLQCHKVSESNMKHGERQLTAVLKYASWNVINMSGTKPKKKHVINNILPIR